MASRARARRIVHRFLAISPAQGASARAGAWCDSLLHAGRRARLRLSAGSVRCGGRDLHAVQLAGGTGVEVGRHAQGAQAGRTPDHPRLHAQATAIRHWRAEGDREPLYP